MSQKEVKDEPMVDIGSTISKSEQFFTENKKAISTGAIAVALLLGGFLYYKYSVVAGASEEAHPSFEKAAELFSQDSVDLALKGNKDFEGFEALSESYSNTPEGNKANYYLAVAYFNQKKYDLALEKIEAFDASGEILPYEKTMLIGDIYSEKNDYETAIKKYLDAAKSANNILISPKALTKAAILAEILNRPEDAVKYYEEVIVYFEDPKFGTEKSKIEKSLGIVKAKVALKSTK